jgi:hypothetical protein
MGNLNSYIRITNETDQNVQICLIDTNNNLIDQKIEPNSFTKILMPCGEATITLVSPVEDVHFKQCYTIDIRHHGPIVANPDPFNIRYLMIIVKENEYLTIKRCCAFSECEICQYNHNEFRLGAFKLHECKALYRMVSNDHRWLKGREGNI